MQSERNSLVSSSTHLCIQSNARNATQLWRRCQEIAADGELFYKDDPGWIIDIDSERWYNTQSTESSLQMRCAFAKESRENSSWSVASRAIFFSKNVNGVEMKTTLIRSRDYSVWWEPSVRNSHDVLLGHYCHYQLAEQSFPDTFAMLITPFSFLQLC